MGSVVDMPGLQRGPVDSTQKEFRTAGRQRESEAIGGRVGNLQQPLEWQPAALRRRGDVVGIAQMYDEGRFADNSGEE